MRCFYQEQTINDDVLNCEYEGILGTVAGIVGIMQANEVLKKMAKEKEISEDDERRMQEEIQKITDEFIIEIDKLIDAKEKDLLAI